MGLKPSWNSVVWPRAVPLEQTLKILYTFNEKALGPWDCWMFDFVWDSFLGYHWISSLWFCLLLCTQLRTVSQQSHCVALWKQTKKPKNRTKLLTDDFIKPQTVGQLPDSTTLFVSLSILDEISNCRQMARLLVSADLSLYPSVRYFLSLLVPLIAQSSYLVWIPFSC